MLDSFRLSPVFKTMSWFPRAINEGFLFKYYNTFMDLNVFNTFQRSNFNVVFCVHLTWLQWSLIASLLSENFARLSNSTHIVVSFCLPTTQNVMPNFRFLPIWLVRDGISVVLICFALVMSEGDHILMWLGAIFSHELSVHILIIYYIFKSVVGLFL